MRYRVALERADEGIAVSVPGLPGCHSQGRTEQEALSNIADAIRGYLAAIAEDFEHAETRFVEVMAEPRSVGAAELRKLPRLVQDAIIEAQAAAAEHEYRTNPDLMVDFDELAEAPGPHEHDPSAEAR